MKAIVLLVSGNIIALITSLFSRTIPLPTESDSVKAICTISTEDCDYDLYQNDSGQMFRNGEERRAFIGDAENGMSFDGDQAYQYVDGKKTLVSIFTFEEFDACAQKLLQRTFGTIDYSVVVSPITSPSLELKNDPAT